MHGAHVAPKAWHEGHRKENDRRIPGLVKSVERWTKTNKKTNFLGAVSKERLKKLKII